MKCQNCDGNGRFEVEDNGVVMQGVYWRCPNCGGKGVVEPLTNEEWFFSLSTEEKAKTIICLAVNSMHKKRKGLIENDVNEIMRWLKEKHDE